MRQSASRVITSLFGWDKPDANDEKALLKDGLRTVSRILYAAGGLHDKNLTVGYSSGASLNSVRSRNVYLDSDIVLKPREGFEDADIRNDVLVGSALIGANVKLTASGEYYDGLCESDENVKRIYQATEFRAAEIHTEREAPGLTPYLDTRSDYYCSQALIDTLNEAAGNEDTSSDTACALLNNSLLHRTASDAINLGVYAEAVNEAVGRLERCNQSLERHETALEIVEWFKELFDQEPPPPEPNGGGDDEEQEDSDDGESSDNPSGGSGKGKGKGEGQPGDGEPGDGGESEGESEGDGEGESEGDGEGNGQPDLSAINDLFDKEMSAVSGEVESETGGSESVKAIAGASNTNDAGEQGVAIGDEAPGNGWGDEVEPVSTRVAHVVTGDADAYNLIKAEVLVGIRALVNKLSWTAQVATMTEHGYRSGDLDEGALTNLFLQDAMPTVFQRTELIARPDVAVGIMVDESGSMSGSKISAARKIAVMLTEAFNAIAGTRVRVWGHSTEGYIQESCIIYPYVTAQHKCPHGIAHMSAKSCNIDGAALWYAAQELSNHDSDAERRVLFCISDGMPSGGQEDGVAYNYRKAEAARKLGVEVFGIGINNAYNDVVGEKMFGKDAFCILPDVESAGKLIGAFVTRKVNRL